MELHQCRGFGGVCEPELETHRTDFLDGQAAPGSGLAVLVLDLLCPCLETA